MKRTWPLVLGMGSLAMGSLVGCSSNSTTPSAPGTSAPGTTAPACSPTSLEVTSTDGSTVTITGPTAVADLLLRNGRTGNFNFANYAIPNSAAYGVSSAGNLTQGQDLVSLALTPTSGKVDTGSYTAASTSSGTTIPPTGAGTVSYFAVSTGAGVQTPVVDHNVELTSVTVDQVCGTITPVSPTKGSASVKGSFTTTRIFAGQADAANQANGSRGTDTTVAGTSSSSSSASTTTASSSTVTSSTVTIPTSITVPPSTGLG